MYERGLGAPQSFRKAAEWYRRAAEKGDARGQLRLGTLYRDGIGVAARPLSSVSLARACGGNRETRMLSRHCKDCGGKGLISERELVMRLASVSATGMTITERGERVREQLAHMLDPIRFFVGQSKRAVSCPGTERPLDHRGNGKNDVLALLPDISHSDG